MPKSHVLHPESIGEHVLCFDSIKGIGVSTRKINHGRFSEIRQKEPSSEIVQVRTFLKLKSIGWDTGYPKAELQQKYKIILILEHPKSFKQLKLS